MDSQTRFRLTAASAIVFLIVAVSLILLRFWALYAWDKNYAHAWTLADNSSTIPAKSAHLTRFSELLEAGYAKGEFARHNAIFLGTPSNGFEENLAALKTLSARLDDIKSMDPESFQYNTAMQQITAQEQGEAGNMIGALQGCYLLARHPLAWDWISITLIIGAGLLFIIAGLFCIMPDHMFL